MKLKSKVSLNLTKRRLFSFLKDLLKQKDLYEDDDTLVITCRLRKNGSGVSRINGHAVTKSFLHQIGRLLVDVNGQTNIFFIGLQIQLEILDAYAHTISLRNEFTFKVEELQKKKQELRKSWAKWKGPDAARRIPEIPIKWVESGSITGRRGRRIEQKKKIMTSIEALKNYSFEVYQALYGRWQFHYFDPGNRQIEHCCEDINKLVDLDPSLKDQLKYVEDAVSGLTEVARDIQTYNEN